jgi:REP element-mobilizing transposase RayT
MHYIFSTKERRPLIAPDLRVRLWAYMGGIARENNMKALAVNGTENHAHVLVSLPATIAVAKAVQLIKGGSSKWVHEAFSGHQGFDWQDGYSSFSVSPSRLAAAVRYIQGQEQHHRETTFEEEYLLFLKKHGLEYDERYVFG